MTLAQLVQHIHYDALKALVHEPGPIPDDRVLGVIRSRSLHHTDAPRVVRVEIIHRGVLFTIRDSPPDECPKCLGDNLHKAVDVGLDVVACAYGFRLEIGGSQ